MPGLESRVEGGGPPAQSNAVLRNWGEMGFAASAAVPQRLCAILGSQIVNRHFLGGAGVLPRRGLL